MPKIANSTKIPRTAVRGFVRRQVHNLTIFIVTLDTGPTKALEPSILRGCYGLVPLLVV